MKKEKLIFHDTETTGVDFKDRIVSSAFMTKVNNKYIIKEDFANPNVLIEPEASVATGITDVMIKDAPNFKKTFNYKALNFYNKKNFVYVAYNAYFDLDMIEKEGIVWKEKNIIDLYRVSKHLLKNKPIEELTPSLKNKIEQIEKANKFLPEEHKIPLEKTNTPLKFYKLQYLRYIMEIDQSEEFKQLLKDLKIKEINPHEAKSDIIVMYQYFYKLKNDFKLSIKKMIDLSNTPVLEEEINYGNEVKGTKYNDVINTKYTQKNTGKERSVLEYLHWYVSNTDPMLDREYTIKYHISKSIINEEVKFKKDYTKYLNYAILYIFNEEETEKALKILEQKPTYINWLKEKFIEKFEKYPKEEKTNEYDNIKFLIRYLKNVREKELKNFIKNIMKKEVKEFIKKEKEEEISPQ